MQIVDLAVNVKLFVNNGNTLAAYEHMSITVDTLMAS